MTIWDFIFPHKIREKIEHDREERRATKEATRRRKEKEKKKRAPEPQPENRGASESSSNCTTSRGTGGSAPKSSDAPLEETSAMAASSDPDEPHPHSWEYEDDGKSSKSQKIKDFVDKSVRRVKKMSSTRSKRDSSKIVSRPIKESTLDRFMEKVKARQESRVRSAERMTRESECVFPVDAEAVRAEAIVTKKNAGSGELGGSREGSSRRKKKDEEEEDSKRKTKSPSREKADGEDSPRSQKSRRSPKRDKKKDKEKKKKKKQEEEKKKEDDDFSDSIRSSKSERSSKSSRTKQSPLKQIQKIFPDLSRKGRQERKEQKEAKRKEKEETRRRKEKERDLFVNGKPFWVAAGKMSAAEKAEMTQDDLPLNAAIILEVRKGNIDLPVMSNTVIKFDPWAPLEVLQARDETLFNHKMLFANTIRSMINSADFTGTDGTSGDGAADTPPRPRHHIVFGPHPTFYWNYDRSAPSKMWREVFRWQGEGVA